MLEPRVEMMPLIDVVFLILTFFIYAMVLMVRIDVLPVPMERYASGAPATPGAAVSLTIALDGQIFLGRRAIELDEVRPAIGEVLETDPGTKVYLIMVAGEGTVDRGPIFTAIWDRLKDAGVDIGLVSEPPPDG